MSYHMPALKEIGVPIRRPRPPMESIAPHYVLEGLGNESEHSYWSRMAQQCKQFADEGECLARVARHAPVTIESGARPVTKAAKRYWRQRAQECKQFADEGECLAQVAKHAPVTIESGGLGITADELTSAIDVAAQIVRNPEEVLKARGPAIVSAIDEHVLEPTIDAAGKAMAPYVIKYLMPPIAILYFLVGVSAYYSYKSYRAHPTVPNRRRRRRKRRTSK